MGEIYPQLNRTTKATQKRDIFLGDFKYKRKLGGGIHNTCILTVSLFSLGNVCFLRSNNFSQILTNLVKFIEPVLQISRGDGT